MWTDNNIITSLVSTAFVLVALMLMFRASLSIENTCDKNTEYTIYEQTSYDTLGCRQCEKCGPGMEPEVPCGTFVLLDKVLGRCIPCKEGRHSAEKDTKPCEVCQSAKCLEHEIIVGTCKIDGLDSSHCTGYCKNGYHMNKEKKLCEPNQPPKTMTANSATNTTKNPDQTSNEDGDDFEMPTIEVVFIVIGALVVVVVAIVIVCCCRKKLSCKWRSQRDKVKGNNGSLSSTRLIKEEEGFEGNGAPEQRSHLSETSGGFVSTVPPVSNDVRVAVNSPSSPDSHIVTMPADSSPLLPSALPEPMVPERSATVPCVQQVASNNVYDVHTSAPPRDGSVVFDMHVMSSALLPDRLPRPMLSEGLPEPVVPGPLTPDRVCEQPAPARPPVLNYCQIPNPNPSQNPSHLSELLFDIYQEICETIDTGAPGKDWKAFACKMDCTTKFVRCIEGKENKTDLVIRSWEVQNGNNILKLSEILHSLGIDCLANKVAAHITV